MNIISGKYKGIKLLSPNSEKTHPMGSREKLALFNMLMPYLNGAMVLDAFAGSGALGIESLSLGAKQVTFIEKSPKVAKTILNNLKLLSVHLSDNVSSKNFDNLELSNTQLSDKTNFKIAEVIISDVVKFTTDKQFNIIIADPPYDQFDLFKIEYLVKFLKKDGIFALSHPHGDIKIEGLERSKTKTYAAATISLYKKG